MKKILLAVLAGVALGAMADNVNFVADGNFAQGFQRWTANPRPAGEIVPKAGPDGQTCCKLSGPLDFTLYWYNMGRPGGTGIQLTEGKTYTLSAWIKTEGINVEKLFSKAVLHVINYGWSSGTALPITGEDGSWRRYSVTFQAPKQQKEVPPDGAGYSLLILFPAKVDGTVWLTDIQVEEGDKMTAFTPCKFDLTAKP